MSEKIEMPVMREKNPTNKSTTSPNISFNSRSAMMDIRELSESIAMLHQTQGTDGLIKELIKYATHLGKKLNE